MGPCVGVNVADGLQGGEAGGFGEILRVPARKGHAAELRRTFRVNSPVDAVAARFSTRETVAISQKRV